MNTSRLKRMSLPFQMNIDKYLSENDMNLDDDDLYNFKDASSQLSRLGEAHEKTSIVLLIFY